MSSALTDLRRVRRRRRLGDTEWFDLAYKVYLAAIFGGAGIIVASDYVGDVELDAATAADVIDRGPAVLGLVALIVLLAGLRSGVEGGPISIEDADVRHLLLAPVDRGSVLRLPVGQRMRTITFGFALTGGVAGLLAGQRLPGTESAWTLWGAVYGACLGLSFVAAAVVAHGLRCPAWAVIVIGAPLVAWQSAAIAGRVAGPADSLGSLAFWAIERRPLDLVAVVTVVALAAVAITLAGRLSVEQLARRGALVSQLRFAVTMQDLRTVVLLRRQLRQEQARHRPWIRLRPAPGRPSTAVVRRGLHGLLRTPAARAGRIGSVAAVAGLAAGAASRGTTPAIVVVGLALFVLGLDLVEPLSQEIDHADRTLAAPRQAGWIHIRLLAGSALAAIPAALIGAAACAIVDRRSALAALALAYPVTLGAMAGSVVNVVRDDKAPDARVDTMVLPEVAGFTDLVRLLLPVAVSTVPALTVLAMREQPSAGMLVRCLAGLVLWNVAVGWWIVRRAELRRRWQAFSQGAMP